MGKVTRWLWGLLGMKKQKEEPSTENPVQSDTREKKRWSFSRMGRESGPADQTRNQNSTPASGPGESSWMRSHEEKQSKHAIAVAAATAAAADAAVAAAHAAVTVVRLTAHGRRNVVSGGTDYALAVIKIQCALRGYLGRRALRALKALVKLQALVRGFLVRKQAAAALRSMEALLRVQYAMRCHRVNRLRRINNMRPSLSSISKRRLSASSYSSYEHARHALDESPKTEHLNRARSGSRRIHLTRNGPVAEGVYYYPGIYSSPKNLREFDWGVMKGADDQSGRGAWTANNTPRLGNGPPTPSKSSCGDGHLWPNYMTNTESFCAKLRSHSAPRQRPEWPETSTAGAARKRLSLNEIMASRNSFSCVRMNGSCAEFTENANF